MSCCSNKALPIKTYLAGQNQATHPNVIAFQEPWHGYRFYMAYTTYPYANGSEENPCLAASNDLLHWEKPSGLINPIACCEETECDELKDSHLLYNEAKDQLEMWYLGRLNTTMYSGGKLYCFRKTSSDGIHWNARETMFCFEDWNLASETVLFEKGTGYRFWGIRNSKEDKGLYYTESKDGFDWGTYNKCIIPGCEQTDIWHGTVTQIDGTYYFVWVGKEGAERNKLFCSVSSDGIVFSQPKQILLNDTGWAFLYRPVLIRENGVFYCFYGVVRIDGKWMIALSAGETVETLEGVNVLENGEDLNERVSSTPKMLLKYRLSLIQQTFIPRLSILLPFSIVLQVVFAKASFTLFCSVLVAAIACRLFFTKKNCVRTGFVMGLFCTSVSLLVVNLAMELIKLLWKR